MRLDRLALWTATCAAAAAALLFTTRSRAFPDYASGCNSNGCHGVFYSGTYTSLKDGSSWGTDLMTGHLDNILGGSGGARCNVCHSGAGKVLVPLNSSNGTGTLPGLGCMGCHGRAEDNTPANPDWGMKTGYGAGLRQHHYVKGITLCAGCHNDANPANYTPVGENVLPPYYGNTTFPLIPTNPCNPNGTEDRIASALGLDNDGDGVFDMSDTDCSACAPTTCVAQGKDCGSIADGCGGTLDCGTCTAPAICSAGVCVSSDAGADTGVPDASSDAQEDAPVEASSDATASDATASDASDATASDASDATTSDASDATTSNASDASDATTSDASDASDATTSDASDATTSDASDATASDAAAGDAAANAEDSGTKPASSGDSGGCACRFAASGPPPAYAWWLLALCATLLVRTRRRRNRKA